MMTEKAFGYAIQQTSPISLEQNFQR